MSDDLRFKEIEHKFIIDERTDVQRVRDVLTSLSPVRTSAVRVRDRYYVTEAGRRRRLIFRHRFDEELQHLTVKTIEVDTEVRLEVNLDLGHHAGDQSAQVESFLAPLEIRWSGTIFKDLEVWEFPDCEVVYYRASTDRHSVRCVEFEATRKESVNAALAVVEKYEKAVGFDATSRAQRSLVQMLFPDVAELLDFP
jgi:hypothetical protein